MSPARPLVSALCVSRGNTRHLHRALHALWKQHYRPVEVVVVLDAKEVHIEDTSQIGFSVRTLVVNQPDQLPLGALRNLSVAVASGPYCIQWDDDDLHHPRRIARQMQALLCADAVGCTLERWRMWDENTGERAMSVRRAWEGSLLCQRRFLRAHPYDAGMRRGEDMAPLAVLKRWQTTPGIGRGLVTIDAPHLYTYVRHGQNAWPPEHWNRLRAGSVPDEDLSAFH